MAFKFSDELVDDIDMTSPAAETVRFALDGIAYAIDLTPENAAKLREDLSGWITSARRESPLKRRKTRDAEGGVQRETTVGATGELNARVRTWARARGFPVGSRGRLPRELIEHYLRDSGQQR